MVIWVGPWVVVVVGCWFLFLLGPISGTQVVVVHLVQSRGWSSWLQDPGDVVMIKCTVDVRSERPVEDRRDGESRHGRCCLFDFETVEPVDRSDGSGLSFVLLVVPDEEVHESTYHQKSSDPSHNK